jgi:hypothetical protein
VGLAARIRRWPAARLALAWANAAALAVLALRAAPPLESGMRFVERPCRGPVECRRYPPSGVPVPDSTVVAGDYRWVARPGADALHWAVLGTALGAVPAAVLAATWVWLGGRQRGR